MKSHSPAIDALRVISILAVILIHTSTRTLEAAHFNVNLVPLALFFNQISRFAVPLFFLLSGFVLELNYGNSGGLIKYFQKRFSRIFIPFIFWSGIYYFLIYKIHTVGFIDALIYGAASYQLYFIPSLLIFYLLFPAIHRLSGLFLNRWILPVLGLIQLWLLYLAYYQKPLDIFYPAGIALLNFFPFLIGILASRHSEKLTDLKLILKYTLIFLVLLLGGLVYWEGRSRFLSSGNYLAFYTQWRPSVLFYTLALFYLLFSIFQRIHLPARVFNSISRLSFFVFFIHVIFLEQTWKLIGPQLFRHIWFDPVFFILTASASFLAAFLVHRIPYLSRLTG